MIIKYNEERYGDLYDHQKQAIPKDINISGVTKEQANWIAERLSDWFPGCDYIYYVEK